MLLVVVVVVVVVVVIVTLWCSSSLDSLSFSIINTLLPFCLIFKKPSHPSFLVNQRQCKVLRCNVSEQHSRGEMDHRRQDVAEDACCNDTQAELLCTG